jgi:hypothetical protein
MSLKFTNIKGRYNYYKHQLLIQSHRPALLQDLDGKTHRYNGKYSYGELIVSERNFGKQANQFTLAGTQGGCSC